MSSRCIALLAVGLCACGDDVVRHSRKGEPLPEPTRFVAANGSDASQCERATPCLTFGRAHEVAGEGEVVEVAGGTYGDQLLPARAPKGSRPVVFRPAAGQGVELGVVRVEATDLELREMSVGRVSVIFPAARFTARDLTAHGFDIEGASDVRWLGGTLSSRGGDYMPIVMGYGDGAQMVTPRNVLIEGTWFHDWPSSSGVSGRCLQIASGDGVTVRRNRFQRCGQSGMYVLHFGAADVPRNITIENNFIEGGDTFSITSGLWEGVLIRHNSMLMPLNIDQATGPASAIRIVANVGTGAVFGCAMASWYEHNVWDDGVCGATDVRAATGFVDSGNFDLHLQAGAAAIDAALPADAPSDDFDGDERPRGAAPDCGADER